MEHRGWNGIISAWMRQIDKILLQVHGHHTVVATVRGGGTTIVHDGGTTLFRATKLLALGGDGCRLPAGSLGIA